MPVSFGLWIICELAIAACDLAEIIGSAIALNLLFGIPLIAGVCITALDVLARLVSAEQRLSLHRVAGHYPDCRRSAAALPGRSSFLVPDLLGIAKGFVPSAKIVVDPGMLYIAIGILGATVMPHNLYLHSSIVQTRRYELTSQGNATRSNLPRSIRRSR